MASTNYYQASLTYNIIPYDTYCHHKHGRKTVTHLFENRSEAEEYINNNKYNSWYDIGDNDHGKAYLEEAMIKFNNVEIFHCYYK